MSRGKFTNLLRFLNPQFFSISMYIVVWLWELPSVLYSIRSLSSLFLQRFLCGIQSDIGLLANVGLIEGINEGVGFDGIAEGTIEGKNDGADDGKLDGLTEGTIEGELDSKVDGITDGEDEGEFDDADDGEPDGALEGSMLGKCDGPFGAILSSQFPNIIVCSSPLSALKGLCSNFWPFQ